MQDKVVKLELESDKKTALILDGQSKICNWLYNHLLASVNDYKEQFKQTQDQKAMQTVYTKRGLRNLVPKIKKEKLFLKTVHSSPLKNTALRLTSSIQSYQKGKKGLRKNKTGWPSFRSWQANWFSLFYDEPKKGFKIVGDKLILSLGIDENGKRIQAKLKLKDKELLKGYPLRNLRIIKENELFFAVFTVKTKVPEKKSIGRIIALDPNHKNMAHGVDTNGKSIEIASPSWLKTYDKRIDEIKSKRDRCQKKSKKVVTDYTEYFLPSKRWYKYNQALKKTLRKRQEQTKTFMFTLSHRLCRDYDCIGIGNYTPHGGGITKKMRRGMNNRSLIGRFKKVLSWTAQKSGKTYLEYNEKGTTRTCFTCGYKIEGGLDPSLRAWGCPICKTMHNRDENAAQNGLKKVFETLKSETLVSQVPCSGLVFVKKQCAWCVFPSGVKETLRGINCELDCELQEMKSKA